MKYLYRKIVKYHQMNFQKIENIPKKKKSLVGLQYFGVKAKQFKLVKKTMKNCIKINWITLRKYINSYCRKEYALIFLR